MAASAARRRTAAPPCHGWRGGGAPPGGAAAARAGAGRVAARIARRGVPATRARSRARSPTPVPTPRGRPLTVVGVTRGWEGGRRDRLPPARARATRPRRPSRRRRPLLSLAAPPVDGAGGPHARPGDRRHCRPRRPGPRSRPRVAHACAHGRVPGAAGALPGRPQARERRWRRRAALAVDRARVRLRRCARALVPHPAQAPGWWGRFCSGRHGV